MKRFDVDAVAAALCRRAKGTEDAATERRDYSA